MATINIDAKCDLNKPVVVRHLDGMVFSQDVKANMIRVSVFRDREPVDLSGGSVSANIIRADGATVVQTGTIEGNVCSVVLPSSAYAVPGQIAIFVKHSTSAGPTTSTIAAITGYVYKSTTDTIVDPGSVVPNVNQLLAMIEDCEDATEACIAATAAAPVIDDTAGAGDTNKVWSANKSNELLTETNSKTDELKSTFDNTLPIKPYNAVFFDGANYFDPLFAEYIDGGLAINASGELFSASSNAKSLVIPVKPSTKYTLNVPEGNRQFIGEKATNDFASGQTITMLVTANADYPCTFTTGATANYIYVYFNSGSYDYSTKKDMIKMCKGDTINNGYPKLNNNYLGQIPGEKLDIFKGVNLFSDADTIYRTDRNINTSTGVIFTSSTAKSIVFPVEANTRYSIYVPDGNRSLVAEGTDSSFAIGSTKTVIVADATIPYPIEFTTGATAKYVFITINVGDYDYATKKSGIKLFKGKYWDRPMPYLPMANMDEEINNLYGLNVLVFGDSITDCCNFTINSSNETTAYSWKNPSNSYIDAGGNAIAYSMWPKILKETQPLGEIRNYALSGASVKSKTREAGSERLNLQYQIDLAINDLDNPNNAFTVDHFVPNIVIFAIGTNDVTPNDTYESAMNVVTYLSDGVSVNVDATMAQLDPTKFCESARLAFLKIRKLFPLTQIYYYLPLQRARYQQNTTSLHTELEKMAKRYGCIIIDGTFESGIIAEFEQVNHLGALLKDGLHPNEKGQNLMARQILASIKSHYMPFEFGFNK